MNIYTCMCSSLFGLEGLLVISIRSLHDTDIIVFSILNCVGNRGSEGPLLEKCRLKLSIIESISSVKPLYIHFRCVAGIHRGCG